ncbi:MAG: 1-hydroxycarotenoid 3,4-desaturase CrtD [Pseudomonadota bacterium]
MALLAVTVGTRLMPRKHVIVVGAGIGGLSAALDLSARGVRVTVLEQHGHPGGKMRQIEINGRGIDSGPTVFTMRWIFDDLFSEIGLDFDAHVPLREADLLARHGWGDGSQLDLFADVQRSVEAIGAFSGGEDAKAYRDFARDSAKIFKTLDLSFMRAQRPSPPELAARVGLKGIPDLIATRPFVTLFDDLKKRFRDPRLVQLFARYSTYCGSSPFRAPATLQLIAHAERAGVWYVEGGMIRLARALADAAMENGVAIRYLEPVTRLLTYDGRITGVQLANGEPLMGDAVVFNGDMAALAEGMLGEDAQRAVPKLPRDRRSLSAITWSMLARVSGFPLAHHTVLFGDDYREEFDAIFEQQRISDSPTVYICAQDRQDDAAPEDSGPERLLALINAPARALSEGDIARAEDNMLNVLARQGLVLEHAPTECARTTPADFAGLFPATDGALYGRPTHGWMGSFSRPGSRTKLEGLYLSGGSVHPGAGVPMVAMSGRLAAACVRADLGLG